MSIKIEWTSPSQFGETQILERRKIPTKDFLLVAKLPDKAEYFEDLGLDSNQEYEYRVTFISDKQSHPNLVIRGKTLANQHKTIFNVKDYGAKGDGVSDDTNAIRHTINLVQEANGGIVFFPKGIYAVAPKEPDGIVEDAVFRVKSSNITFLGEGPEESVISAYAPGLLDPETNWGTNKRGEIGRGETFAINTDNFRDRLKNIVFKGLRVTGNTRPTGKTEWWTNEQRIDGWDIRHKGLQLGAYNEKILVVNCIWENYRGEIIYCGDPNSGKLKLVDTIVRNTNSSAISTSADFECDNVTVLDAANSCVESAFFKDLNGRPTGIQNGVFRNSRFRARDSMLTDPIENSLLMVDKAGRHGLAIFNAPGTYMVIENCTVENAIADGCFFDVAQHNLLIIDSTFIDSGTSGFLNFKPKDKSDYQMLGGINSILIKNNEFIQKKISSNILNMAIFGPSFQKDFHFTDNKIIADGGKISTVFYDSFPHQDGRENLVISGNQIIVKNGGHIQTLSKDEKESVLPAIKPLYINNHFDADIISAAYGDPFKSNKLISGVVALSASGPYKDILYLPRDSVTEFEMGSFLNRYPEKFSTTITRTNSDGNATLIQDGNWNDFPFDLQLNSRGDSLKIVKHNGIFNLQRYLDHNVLNFGRKRFVYINGDQETTSFSMFSGCRIGDIVSVVLDAPNITLINSDFLDLDSNENYTSGSETMEFIFTRIGDQLVELDRNPHCPNSRSLILLPN